MKFETGDVVTRAGDDRQRVLWVTEDGFAMEVECIKAPAAGWCKLGDVEYNLCRRYTFAGEIVDGILNSVPFELNNPARGMR